jgi:isopentenyl phosphate kinase
MTESKIKIVVKKAEVEGLPKEFDLEPITVGDVRTCLSRATASLSGSDSGNPMIDIAVQTVIYLMNKKGKFDGKNKTVGEIEELPFDFFLQVLQAIFMNYPGILGLFD